VPLGSMRHSPLCFTGISALAIRSFTSSLSFGERHRRAGQLHLQGWFPDRSRRLRQRMPWANPILACSVFRLFPHSAGARLCRMTWARKGSGCCHRAVIRHIQEFGIVPERVPAYPLRDSCSRYGRLHKVLQCRVRPIGFSLMLVW
jgi:hypothetical protein